MPYLNAFRTFHNKWPLWGAALSCIVLRLANWPSAFVGGRLFPFDSDPAYHFRRIQLLIHHFPHIPVQDPLLAYPLAGQVQWPPLFDLLCAALFPISSFFSSDPKVFEIVLGAFIPVLAAVSVFMTYAVTAKLFNPRAGTIAAWIVALTPAHIFISMFGRVDHHVLEPLLLLGLLLCAEKDSVKSGFVAALILVGAVLSFPLTYYAYAGYLTLAFLVRPNKFTPVAWFFVSLFSLLFSFSDLWRSFNPWDIQIPGLSWLCFSLANFFLTAGVYLRRSTIRNSRIYSVLCLSACGFVSYLLLRHRAPDFLLSVADRSDKNFLLVGENAGLFTLGPLPYFRHYLWMMTPLSLLAFPAARSSWKTHPLLVVFFVGSFLQSLLFVRFLPIFDVVSAILASIPLSEFRFSLKPKAVIVALLLAISGLVTLKYERELWQAEAHYPSELLPTLEWLKKNSPPASRDVWDENEVPQYGVLSHAAFGGFLTYYAERPTLDSPFDTDKSHAARRTAIEIRLARNEAEAWKKIDRDRVRYVVTYPSMEEYPDLEAILGRPGGSSTSGINAKTLSYLEMRLHLLSGSYAVFENALIPALEHFRLMYESPEERFLLGKPFPTFRIFEAVKGARVLWNSPLPEPGLLELAVSVRHNKSFFYRAALRSGQIDVIVPYPTGSKGDVVSTGDEYTLRCGARSIRFRVSEEDVSSGKLIRVRR